MPDIDLKPLRSHIFDEQEITVSVVIIAYNVSLYISEAIESILDQIVNFRVEIVVSDDASTDGTQELISKYKKLFPSTITTLFTAQNRGITGNCIEAHRHCRGEFIALCDGDDYWLDSSKLKLQVDFLRNYKNFSAHCHQSLVIYSVLDSASHPFNHMHDCDLGIRDTIHHRKFHTSSLVYRKRFWESSGGIPPDIFANERAIYPMLAIYGPLRFSERIMCVYRKHQKGISRNVTYKQLEQDFGMLPFLKSLSPTFPVRRFKYFLHLCVFSYAETIPLGALFYHYFLFVLNSFSAFPFNFGEIKYGTQQFIKKLIAT